MFLNLGNGRFVDASSILPINFATGASVLWGDLDGNHTVDLVSAGGFGQYFSTARQVKAAGVSLFGTGCIEDALTLCLVGGRYKVTSIWTNQYAGGATADLSATRLTDATGAFWFSDSGTYEYLIRISSATNNGRAWISIPTFTDVEFRVLVQDTVTGQAQTYHSVPGNETLLYDPYFFVYP
jgi:hypothetical protein